MDEPITITTDAIKTIGVYSTIVAILLYLLVDFIKNARKDKKQIDNIMIKDKEEQGALIYKEREELKSRVFLLEKELSGLNEFIRNSLITIITKNDHAFNTISDAINKMSESNKQIVVAIEDLKKNMNRRRSTDTPEEQKEAS